MLRQSCMITSALIIYDSYITKSLKLFREDPLYIFVIVPHFAVFDHWGIKTKKIGVAIPSFTWLLTSNQCSVHLAPNSIFQYSLLLIFIASIFLIDTSFTLTHRLQLSPRSHMFGFVRFVGSPIHCILPFCHHHHQLSTAAGA